MISRDFSHDLLVPSLCQNCLPPYAERQIISRTMRRWQNKISHCFVLCAFRLNKRWIQRLSGSFLFMTTCWHPEHTVFSNNSVITYQTEAIAECRLAVGCYCGSTQMHCFDVFCWTIKQTKPSLTLSQRLIKKLSHLTTDMEIEKPCRQHSGNNVAQGPRVILKSLNTSHFSLPTINKCCPHLLLFHLCLLFSFLLFFSFLQ